LEILVAGAPLATRPVASAPALTQVRAQERLSFATIALAFFAFRSRLEVARVPASPVFGCSHQNKALCGNGCFVVVRAINSSFPENVAN
jgi:hypothetical protein